MCLYVSNLEVFVDVQSNTFIMRKTTCIIYFVCIASLNSFSQKLFSFDALAKMTKCSDVSCFDDSVTNNGYSFSKTIELTNGAGTMTLYSGDNPESDGMANQMSIVVFNENGGNARSVALRTTNKAYYLKVKKYYQPVIIHWLKQRSPTN